MSRIHLSTDTTGTLESVASPQPVFGKSIFQAHQLQPTEFQITRLHQTQPDWMLAIFVTCFILLAWVQVFYPKRVLQIFRAPFSKRFTNQLIRDGNLFKERIVIALGIVYLLSSSLFLFEINEQILGFTFPGFTGILLYGMIMVVGLGVLTAKVALVQFLGIIFKTRETTSNYLLNLLIFALLSGPVLLVALVCIIYLKSLILLQLCLGILALILLFRFMRGFFIGMALTKFSYLFLFVYLCSLEILPFLVLIKIMLNYTHTTGE